LLITFSEEKKVTGPKNKNREHPKTGKRGGKDHEPLCFLAGGLKKGNGGGGGKNAAVTLEERG